MKTVSKTWQLIIDNWDLYGFWLKKGRRKDVNKSLDLLVKASGEHVFLK